MERDKTHEEQLERWAEYVKTHPYEWKSRLKPFLDAQLIMSRRFYKKMAQTEEGKKKIELLREK